MNTKIFSCSVSSAPVLSYHWGSTGPSILILSGVHGDEIEGVFVGQKLISEFQKKYDYNMKLTIVPMFNIDGVLQKTRTNSNHIDLNRNLPTKDWSKDYTQKKYYPGVSANSEPENQSLTQWIEVHQPKLIISLHSWKPMINVNGDCNPEASILSTETQYQITQDIGYPTPGSLGTYCGLERGIPTITYEIERGIDGKKAIGIHVPAIQKALYKSQYRS